MSPDAQQVMWRHFYPGSEPPPTMGVREPRRPKPPDLSPGYALPLPPSQDTGEGARVTEVVAPREG